MKCPQCERPLDACYGSETKFCLQTPGDCSWLKILRGICPYRVKANTLCSVRCAMKYANPKRTWEDIEEEIEAKNKQDDEEFWERLRQRRRRD